MWKDINQEWGDICGLRTGRATRKRVGKGSLDLVRERKKHQPGFCPLCLALKRWNLLLWLFKATKIGSIPWRRSQAFIKLTCFQTRGKSSENIMVFTIECLVLAQRRAFRTPICQEVPDWPVPAVREESDPFYPSWRKKTSFCFHPRLTKCFLLSFFFLTTQRVRSSDSSASSLFCYTTSFLPINYFRPKENKRLSNIL